MSEPVRYLNFVRFAECHGSELRERFEVVLESGIYIGGSEVDEFERAFAAFCGTTHAVGVANGTEAIELVLRAWGIGRGDEVIVPANSPVMTGLAVTHAGARLVLADVEPDTGLIRPAAVEAALTGATRAIVPVHLYGHPAEMGRLREIAADAGIRILEDAAHAHGARYGARRCGSLADAAAFSFYPTKNLGALGDAGCVTTDDPELAGQVRILRNVGLASHGTHDVKGYNSRLDPVQAAILRWKLERLDGWNERRRELARIYLAELADLREITLPAAHPWATPVWHAFPICVHDGLRDTLQRALLEDGIETNVHYRVPIHLEPCYADGGWEGGDFPVSERRASMLLSLPLDAFHTESEIARVIACVRAGLLRRSSPAATA
jgi:dTDP-3-amino-3,4,6-trideoxy-alpha-D-glucose transaminase